MKVSFSGADDDSLNSSILEIGDETIDTIEKAMKYVYEKEPRARKSFFKSDGSLANGAICLVDDQDIEINNNVSKDSHIVFISTLHGG